MSKPHMAARTPEEAKRQAELEKQIEMQIKSDVQHILQSPEGLRFFRFMIGQGMVFTTTFTGNERTYFNEGARNFVNMILRYVSNRDLLRLLKKEEREEDE